MHCPPLEASIEDVLRRHAPAPGYTAEGHTANSYQLAGNMVISILTSQFHAQAYSLYKDPNVFSNPKKNDPAQRMKPEGSSELEHANATSSASTWQPSIVATLAPAQMYSGSESQLITDGIRYLLTGAKIKMAEFENKSQDEASTGGQLGDASQDNGDMVTTTD
ncbi:hypothetical protein KEM54_002570 [Ascosphaera aggregata]|nr:hypothetical protein KEM54_002570 [Ascosphaera aggregata]